MAAPGAARDRLREARDRLAGAQKTSAGVPAYLRYVNRPIGGALAALAHAVGLSPNHLTALGAACSATAIAVLGLLEPTPVLAVVISFLLLLGFALDSADGQLARVRGVGSPAGEWLDHVVDVARMGTLHAAVAVSLFRFGEVGSASWLLVPMAFGIVSVTYFFASMLRDQLGARPVPGSGAAAVGSPLRSLLLLPMDFGLLCLTFVALPWTGAFLAAYGGLFVVASVFAVQSSVKAYRALAALT